LIEKTLILGSGSHQGNLKAMVEELGLSTIDFTGQVPHREVFDNLMKADIYVSCSKSDSTSVSLLEAMACGLFPVVSDIEGNREWIEHGQNGLMFEVGDVDSLSRMIIWAAENPGLRERARKHNFELIEKHAVWENNMSMVEEEFGKLVRG
jgi:glycosyltransferase involved in cell wall biosynthesis